MKLYKAYDVFKSIADAGAKVYAAGSGPYVVVWPAPEPYLRPRLPRYGYVFTEQNAEPGGGLRRGRLYTMRKYRISEDACKMPRKYRDMLIDENVFNR